MDHAILEDIAKDARYKKCTPQGECKSHETIVKGFPTVWVQYKYVAGALYLFESAWVQLVSTHSP